MMKSIFCLFPILLILSACGNDTPAFLLGISRNKFQRSGLIMEADAFRSMGNSRITNPRTAEDFAINQIQDIYSIHQNFKTYALSQGIFLPEPSNSYGLKNAFTYSPGLVLKSVNAIKKDMPAELQAIYLGKASFPKVITFEPALLNYWANVISIGNQMAVRWQQLIAPQIAYWKKFQKKDVRGYAFFKNFADIDKKLLNFNTQDEDFKNKSKTAIFSMCLNNGYSIDTCNQEMNDPTLDGRMFAIYYKYLTRSEDNYKSFFKIQQKMDFINWPDNKIFSLGLSKPSKADVASVYKSTVENAWKFKDEFALQVLFYHTPDSRLGSVNIKENTIAHVLNFRSLFISTNDLNFNPQTVIHETGHLLGFPDCYLEYVDGKTGEAVYYEINQHNIMCSMGGQVEEQHFLELKKIY
ncbi:MAG: hypothetical protein ACOYL6_01495 [Bacteriovoracaceae bacterium]